VNHTSPSLECAASQPSSHNHSDAPDVNEVELRTMRDQMTHRGPDGSGEWFGPDRRVALVIAGFRSLTFLPPVPSPCNCRSGNSPIVFNGEIYNYRELRTGLEKSGHHFFSNSDTEVLLRLYADHGGSMLESLRGMFAFAIWDGKRRGMFLARDPYGIKPLYLTDDGKVLRARHRSRHCSRVAKSTPLPIPAGHTGFFLWGHLPEPYTLYREFARYPLARRFGWGPTARGGRNRFAA